MPEIKIINVDENNISQYPPTCFLNPKNKGYGSLLVKESIKDAEKQGKYGVAVITSEGAFMVGKDLFLKNGFTSVAFC